MTLFQYGKFLLHSGEESTLKIECDALSYTDWYTLAKMIAERCSFTRVIGVPRGGLALERALSSFASVYGPTLVVDDVWTTGTSMEPYLQTGYVGYVVFARRPILDSRVRALFTLDAK